MSRLHPLHAILLAFPLAFFSGGLVSDIAYLKTAVIQWSNFSAWLIAGGTVFGGLVLLWALLGAFSARRMSRGVALFYLAMVAVAWVAGLVNCFKHSADAWASVGALGLTLSTISTVASLLAAWIGHSEARQ